MADITKEMSLQTDSLSVIAVWLKNCFALTQAFVLPEDSWSHFFLGKFSANFVPPEAALAQPPARFKQTPMLLSGHSEQELQVYKMKCHRHTVHFAPGRSILGAVWDGNRLTLHQSDIAGFAAPSLLSALLCCTLS
jgi:hypothetical protein